MQAVVLGKALKVSNCRGKLPRKCKRTWYPNVSIHILHAVLCIFTEVLTRRICQFNPIQFYLNSHEYSVLEKVIIITVRSVTNINIKNTVQSEEKKQNNRNNLQFIVTKDI